MTTHSSILAWKIPWTEEPVRLHSPKGHKELAMTEHLSAHTRAHTHTHMLLFVLSAYESTITSKHKIEFEKDIVYGYGGVD